VPFQQALVMTPNLRVHCKKSSYWA